MTARILQIVLGFVFLMLATPKGMAKETICEEVRADYSADGLQDFDEPQKAFAFDEAALLADGEISFLSNERSETDEEKQEKRQHRQQTHSKFYFKNRIFTDLAKKHSSEGTAASLPPVRARQERTKTIRFLQQEADGVC